MLGDRLSAIADLIGSNASGGASQPDFSEAASQPDSSKMASQSNIIEAVSPPRPVSVVADIGCDHGKLSVYLRKRGYGVIAADTSERAAEKARRAAERAGVTLDVRIGDGLSVLRVSEANGLVIAGLGGHEILRILDADAELAHSFERIVLQPMQRQDVLRRGLYERGFAILDEAIVRDDGRLFELLLVKSGEPLPFPPCWPEGFYELGWQCILRGDEHAAPLIAHRKRELAKRIREAERGCVPAALAALRARLSAYERVGGMLKGTR